MELKKDLRKEIEEKIKKENITLLGQIEISDEDYEELKKDIVFYLDHLYMATVPQPNIRLAIVMVQVAIRHYREGRYWPCFLDELGIDISGSKQNYLGRVFIRTLREYHLFELERENQSSQMYVENIKAHAFVTDYYLDGFFDFSYAFYDYNLLGQITDDIEDDIEDLSWFMKTTLSSDNDYISDDTRQGTKKTYRLLKSTRQVFAGCNPDILKSLFMPTLELIDRYNYENEIPGTTNNRFERGFVSWCKKQQEEVKDKQKRQPTVRGVYNPRPYLKVLMQNKGVFLVIPQQKFRKDDCDGTAYVKVTIREYTKETELELFTHYGTYFSEERFIPVPDLFDAINIEIDALVQRTYQIKKSFYRVLNDSYVCISKLSAGHNYVFTIPNIPVEFKNREDLIDSYTEAGKWSYYSLSVNDKTVVYVNHKPLSSMGEFSFDPVFEESINHFKVFDSSNSEIIATRMHPIVSAIIDKTGYGGSVLVVNNRRFRIADINGISSFEWPEDNTKTAVSIPVNELIEKTDGRYKLVLDIPGKSKKTVCEYLLFTNFSCKFNKPRYVYDTSMTLTVYKYGKTVYPEADNWILKNDNEIFSVYEIPIDRDMDEIVLKMVDDEIYTVKMATRVFKYGFSRNNMQIDKPEYIWYADIGEILYVKIPGAESAGAYWNNDKFKLQKGEKVEEGLFRIDTSEIERKIKDEANFRWQHINIEYCDNAIRHIPLPHILRHVWVEPLFDLKYIDGEVCMESSVIGPAELYIDVSESRSGAKLIEHRKVENGLMKLPELTTNVNYDISPVMVEADEFGFDCYETVLRKVCDKICIDESNLIDCALPVQSVIFAGAVLKTRYKYMITLKEKLGDTEYAGYMTGRDIADKNAEKKKLGKAKVIIEPNEDELELRVMLYDYDYEEWSSPWFDLAEEEWRILKPDDPILESTDRKYKDRIIELDEESTVFIVKKNGIRRY